MSYSFFFISTILLHPFYDFKSHVRVGITKKRGTSYHDDALFHNSDIPLQKVAYLVRRVLLHRPPEDFLGENVSQTEENIKMLKTGGINVIRKSGFHQKFTVTDDQTVWYGSVNFLSFGTNEESIMRFMSRDLAGVLTDTVLP